LKEKKLKVAADATLEGTIMSTGVSVAGLRLAFAAAGKPNSRAVDDTRALEAAVEDDSSADSADGNVFSTQAT
jgi:hypothetical protein